jgi:DNA-binding CsgD family transcriptional regulator
MTHRSMYAQHAKAVSHIVFDFFGHQHINCFSHSRIFADGSRAELWSDHVALEHTYLNTTYTTQTHAPDLYAPQERIFFLNDKIQTFTESIKKNYEIHLSEQRELFNHDNTLFMRGNDPLCQEFFCFYSAKNDHPSKIFLSSNIPLIQSFIKTYQQKACLLIKQAEEHRIVRPWLITKAIDHPALTPRETQVARQLTYNKTAHTIADDLHLKRRTIEGYIVNIKDKYQCGKKSALIALLKQHPSLF